MSAQDASTRPHLKIVRGDATPEEVAALVTALAEVAVAAQATPQAKVAHERHNWRNPSHRIRRPLTHGPGAWRAATRAD